MQRNNVQEIYHNAIRYRYPDGSQEWIVSAEPIFREPGWESTFAEDRPLPLSGAKRQKEKKSAGEDRERSARRARAKLRRLALSSPMDYFVTLTLDGSQIDRYDSAAIMKKVNAWLDNMVRRNGLRYILVPERHKDGAFHFHGFMAGDGLQAVDSGIRWDDRPVYNLPQWKFGFTTAQRLYGDYAAAVAYCCKYIGKQDGERPMGRWYYSGGDLAQPDRELLDVDYREVEGDWEFAIPGSLIKGKYERSMNNEDEIQTNDRG